MRSLGSRTIFSGMSRLVTRNQRPAHGDADRAGAGDAGEGFGDADTRGGEFLIVGLQDDAGKSANAGKNLRREKFGFAEDDALGAFGGALDRNAHGKR